MFNRLKKLQYFIFVMAVFIISHVFAYDVKKLGDAQTLANAGRHQEAMKIYELLIKEYQKDPNLYFYMAKSLKALNQKDAAFNAYGKAAALEAETPAYKGTIEFTYPYVKYCHELGRIKQCLGSCKRVLSVVSAMKDEILLMNNKWALIEIAEALFDSKQYDLAADCYAAFEKISPASLKDRDRLQAAATYALAKRYKPAFRILKDLEKKYPDNLDVLMQLADTYFLKGDKEAAKSYANKVLAKYPDNTDAKALLKEFSQ